MYGYDAIADSYRRRWGSSPPWWRRVRAWHRRTSRPTATWADASRRRSTCATRRPPAEWPGSVSGRTARRVRTRCRRWFQSSPALRKTTTNKTHRHGRADRFQELIGLQFRSTTTNLSLGYVRFEHDDLVERHVVFADDGAAVDRFHPVWANSKTERAAQ